MFCLLYTHASVLSSAALNAQALLPWGKKSIWKCDSSNIVPAIFPIECNSPVLKVKIPLIFSIGELIDKDTFKL